MLVFDFIIIFVNSQHAHTTSKSNFEIKIISLNFKLNFNISDIQIQIYQTQILNGDFLTLNKY